MANRCGKKIDDALFEKIPRYLNTPIDAVGAAVVDLIMPPGLCMVAVDRKIDPAELVSLQGYLIDEWGISGEFLCDYVATLPSTYDEELLCDYIEHVNKACKKIKELKAGVIKEAVLECMEEVIRADGRIDPREVQLLDRLKEELPG